MISLLKMSFGSNSILEVICYQQKLTACCLWCLEPIKKTEELLKHSYVVHQMATIVEHIWSKADCCPFSKKYIMKLFDQNIWKPYLYLRRERHLSSSVPVVRIDHIRKIQVR